MIAKTIGLLVLLQVTASIAANPCAGNKGSSFRPGAFCNEYYHCSDELAQFQLCPGTLYFQEALQMCYYPDYVACTKGTNPCIGNTGVRFVNGQFCSEYYTCVDEVPQAQVCPNGLVFDLALQSCNYADKTTCTTALTNPCVGNKGTTFVNGPTCEQYYTCVDEAAYLQTCPSGYWFDKLVCSQGQATAGASCEGGSGGGNPTNVCAGNVGVSFKKGPTCPEYITCQGEVAHLQRCPNGYHFDPVGMNCNVIGNVAC